MYHHKIAQHCKYHLPSSHLIIEVSEPKYLHLGGWGEGVVSELIIT